MPKLFNLMLGTFSFTRKLKEKDNKFLMQEQVDKIILSMVTRENVDRGLISSLLDSGVRRELIPAPSKEITRLYISHENSPSNLPGDSKGLTLVKTPGFRKEGVFEAPIARIGEEFALAGVNRNLGLKNQKYVYSENLPIVGKFSYPNLTGQMNPDGILVEWKEGNYKVHGSTDCKNQFNASYTPKEQIILPSHSMTDLFLRKTCITQLGVLERNSKRITDSSDREAIKEYIEEKEILMRKLEKGELDQPDYLSEAIKLKHQYYPILQRNQLAEATYVTDKLIGYEQVQQDLKNDPDLEEYNLIVQKDLKENNGFYNYYKSNENFRMLYDKDKVNFSMDLYEELLNKLT